MPHATRETPTFSAFTGAPAEVAVELLFVPVWGPDDTLEDLPGIDVAVGGEWTRAVGAGEFRYKLHDCLLARVTGGWRATRICFIGAGPRADLNAERLRRVAATCGYAARTRGATSIGWIIRRGLPLDMAVTVVADGLSAAEFDSGTYKSGTDKLPSYPGVVAIVAEGAPEAVASAAVARGRIVGECVNFTRSLANEPANVLTPTVFARRVEQTARGVKLAVDILDQPRMESLGMRLLLGVAQGSAEPPRMIVLRHDPPGAPASPVLGLVGKGVTFDTGGISIKPAEGMERMKDDMAGGASVAGTMCAVARLGCPFRVIGVIPSVENMPGGRAMRPGDVIVGASGTSVEIINTDAEGRLILADALWYAQQLGATHLVDVATLTGACMVALGRTVSGLFGTPDGWVDTVRRAADCAGDRLWPLPIYEEAREQLRSEIADLINSAGRPGGAITAAAFLREFAGTGPWAHIDIAGTAWAESRRPYQPKGATGVAVRTLIELAMSGGRPGSGRTD